jgi:hypothetical protein
MNTQTHRELHSRLSHWDGRNPFAPPPFRLIAHTPSARTLLVLSLRVLICVVRLIHCWLGDAKRLSSHPPHPKFRENKKEEIGSMRRLSGGGGCKMSTIASRQKGQGMRSRE